MFTQFQLLKHFITKKKLLSGLKHTKMVNDASLHYIKDFEINQLILKIS